MARPRKSTIARDSVFGRRQAEPETSQPTQGITTDDGSASTQTAVWLTDRERDWLDDRVGKIRKDGWKTVTRSAFIRAIIRAGMDAQMDLDGVSGEEELTERVRQAQHRE